MMSNNEAKSTWGERYSGDVRQFTSWELVDMQRWALSEAMRVIEDNGGEIPMWLDAVWSFSWEALLPYRRAELLPQIDEADKHWTEQARHITERYCGAGSFDLREKSNEQ